MKTKIAAILMALAMGGQAFASDHDDGENDQKARALNLTDHYAYRQGPDVLTLSMYINPRSLPGYAYSLSENARYEFHVVARTARPPLRPAPATSRSASKPPAPRTPAALSLLPSPWSVTVASWAPPRA